MIKCLLWLWLQFWGKSDEFLLLTSINDKPHAVYSPCLVPPVPSLCSDWTIDFPTIVSCRTLTNLKFKKKKLSQLYGGIIDL